MFLPVWLQDLVESSGDDSDVVMEDSEDEGPPAKGAKGKKGAKGSRQQQQQAGSGAGAKKGGSQATPTAKVAPSGGRKLPGSLVRGDGVRWLAFAAGSACVMCLTCSGWNGRLRKREGLLRKGTGFPGHSVGRMGTIVAGSLPGVFLHHS